MPACTGFELWIHLWLLTSILTSGLKYWPDGLYGLPMAASGCPNDPSVNWRLGTLYQDCEDTDPETHHSFSFNLKASIIQGDVERSFCMKTTTFFDSRRKAWPPGKYCIYLSGRSCPLGMTAGWIMWDDENASIPGTSNRNHRNGTLPAGMYDSNTLIYYCCSTSGSAQYPISLPLESPFYLIAYGTRTCQAVRGAKSTLEYIYYETEIFTLMSMDDYGGAHPYGVAKGGKGHVIFYCYYTPIYCPPLKRPDNGKLKPFRCGERNNNKFNDTCSLSCNPGYAPENPAGQVTTCLENGTWSNPSLTGCKRSFQNITASPVTKYLTTSSTPVLSWTQSRLQQTTASTPLNLSTTSCIVSPPRVTVSSSVIQVSRASSLWKSTTPSPTLPSVGSSIPPVGEEVGSSHNTLQGTNFLIGAIAGGALLLVIIILSIVIRRRRAQSATPRRGTGVKVYMSEIEETFTMDNLYSDSEFIHKRSSKENLLHDSCSARTVEYEDKAAENLLYESCGTRFSVTKVEDNVLYESMSFHESQDEKDSETLHHHFYKTVT